MATELNRISITYKLSFETPFHCGTGLRDGLIDRAIVRDHDKFLYVPGSTIKGVVREHCERLARMYSDHDKDMSELIASPHDAKIALFALGRRTSMITRIFGSHYNPGHLFFEDAHLEKTEKEKYGEGEEGGYRNLQTELYTQVRLDRPTRTAVSGALYTSEFGIKDVILEGSIAGWLRCTPIAGAGEKAPTYSLLLLLAGLHLMDRIGGNKSTGKGKCRCEVDKVTVNETTYEKEGWQIWFDHLGKLADYTKEGADWEEDE
jgi:CRISPR/Cas system CMR subunit Cmr4 (Cas7 group RAMP superfamily)